MSRSPVGGVPRVSYEGGVPPAAGAGFAGFDGKARDLLAELAARQDVGWYVENRDDFERLVRAPAAALASDLDRALAARGLKMCTDRLVPMRRRARRGRRQAPYHPKVTIVLKIFGRRDEPPTVLVEYGHDAAHVRAGFLGLGWLEARAVAAALAGEPARLAAVAAVMGRAGFSVPDVEATLACGVAERRSGISVFLEAAIPTVAFAGPGIVGRVAELCTAAAPLLALAPKTPRGRRVAYDGVNGAGI